ncbi:MULTISPECIES: mismatch repair protein [Acidobacteriaceae]|uniref:MutS-related protein n=1 Tax=Acidobacteriaceae TaxID=204434 RepID=UPI0020B12647|nr:MULTISPECIES: mismatch repair protein [Acidobacteriaceae]MDW5264232.1 mismatch repair protein [Edaphobacter sp.]
MPPPTAPTPSEEYRQRQQAREATVLHFEKVHRSLGNLRLLLVIMALFIAWFSFYREIISAWWLLLPAAIFVAVAIYHGKILRRKSFAERAANVYRKGMARIEDRWIGGGQQAPRAEAATSLYATDLDLFGAGSLFELLSQARTCMGEDTLAHWLLSPSQVSEITERHAAITELRNRLDLREDMAILGEDSAKLKTGVHPKALLQWAEQPTQLKQQNLRWTALLLAILAIAGAIVWGETGIKTPLLLVLVVEAFIAFSLRDQLDKVFARTDRALADLELLSSLLARLEDEPFTSPRLVLLKQQLSSHAIPGSKAIARLKTIVQYIDSRDNLFIRLFDKPLLYSVQVAFAAEAWRRAHGGAVSSWLNAVGEMEALLSIAAYSYEHPADPFPEFIEGTPTFHAEELGHPLIPIAKCVRNTVSISGKTRALLISGSNMSGKSTLMRTVGINTVLAMAGAPVRAQRLQLTPLHVAASILVNDSLQEGSSRFYAEITRLRHICDLAEQHPPILFLLDELLQGTNSKDRLIGAEAVVSELIDSGAIGIISTHDLALTDMQRSGEGRLQNMHLQDEIEDGKMKFDFKLRDGIVTKSNGVELMRLIGLKV